MSQAKGLVSRYPRSTFFVFRVWGLGRFRVWGLGLLGIPVVPVLPLHFGVSLRKLSIKKQGTFTGEHDVFEGSQIHFFIRCEGGPSSLRKKKSS